MSTQIKRTCIIDGARIPFCKSNGPYADLGNRQMGIKVVSALVERHGLIGQALGEVAFGSVIKHSSDWNLAREVALSSGLSATTPGITLQRACATSLDAVIHIANQIRLGQIECGIAAGADTASDVPIVHNKRFAKRLLDSVRARTFMQRLRAWRGFGLRELKPDFPGVLEPRTGKSMGEHCQIMADEWRIPREEQDRLALASHQKAKLAYDRGFYRDLVVPFRGLTADALLRPDSALAKLAALPPAFTKNASIGALTAGNSTALTDGAAAVLLSSEEYARERGWPALAYLGHSKAAAVDFTNGEGLLMAPTVAVAELLKETKLTLQDFDFYEIHEAFAAQVLCTLRAWESEDYCKQRLGLPAALGAIDPAKLNVVGSSLALGHPFAATGARIVATLAKRLAEKGSGRGLISICTAGGMGVAAIVER